VLLAALALSLASVHSYEYGYEYGYDGLYGDDAVYDYLDDYGYYSDDGDLYYEVRQTGSSWFLQGGFPGCSGRGSGQSRACMCSNCQHRLLLL
jgi:hypothetical protein